MMIPSSSSSTSTSTSPEGQRDVSSNKNNKTKMMIKKKKKGMMSGGFLVGRSNDPNHHHQYYTSVNVVDAATSVGAAAVAEGDESSSNDNDDNTTIDLYNNNNTIHNNGKIHRLVATTVTDHDDDIDDDDIDDVESGGRDRSITATTTTRSTTLFKPNDDSTNNNNNNNNTNAVLLKTNPNNSYYFYEQQEQQQQYKYHSSMLSMIVQPLLLLHHHCCRNYFYMLCIILLFVCNIIVWMIVIRNNTTTSTNLQPPQCSNTNNNNKNKIMIPYQPNISQQYNNDISNYDESFRYFNTPQLLLPKDYDSTTTTIDNDNPNYYVSQPDIVNNTMVFIYNGNVYYTQLLVVNDGNDNSNNRKNDTIRTTSTTIQLTTYDSTMGIRASYPKINPIYPYYIIFLSNHDSNYGNINEIYLLDLRTKRNNNNNIQLVTYHEMGVVSISGWIHDGTTILYTTYSTSTTISILDQRLYTIQIIPSKYNENDNNAINAINTTTTTTTSNTNIYDGTITNQLLLYEVRPVPLSQAVMGTIAMNVDDDGANDNTDNVAKSLRTTCMYYVRVQQESHTARYVGGTTEQISMYCWYNSSTNNHNNNNNNNTYNYTIPLLTSSISSIYGPYNGTSTQPKIYTISTTGLGNQSYLFFMSDRGYSSSSSTDSSSTWIPTTMNLWAVPIPTNGGIELYNHPNNHPNILQQYIQLTFISCQYNHMHLREYTIDPITNNVILRIGADVYILSASYIQQQLTTQQQQSSSSSSTSTTIQKPQLITINLHPSTSSSSQVQERIIDIDMSQHLTDFDVYINEFSQLYSLLTVRGQVLVQPVLMDSTQQSNNIPFQGSGQNIPLRRYRVIPGTYTGGITRVLQAQIIPKLQQRTGTTTMTGNRYYPNDKIYAIVLATDPDSPTGELGFYMIEVQSNHINLYNDINHFPKPFIGGNSSTGGSTKDGGLGTIRIGSVTISPCGRRFAWTDTDDRICVMTTPLYRNMTTTTSTSSTYHCLPKYNNLNEPLAGTLSELRWSPGGRYIAIKHHARNQMKVISIVDCGNPELPVSPTSRTNDSSGDVADIVIGPIIQVTSNRFNSFGMYWGKSRWDIYLHEVITPLSDSYGLTEPDDVATTLYYLSDRDIVNDVVSPWGTRTPLPHFRTQNSELYALPLYPKLNVLEEQMMMARYAGDGGMESFAGHFTSYEEQIQQSQGSGIDEDGSKRQLKEATIKIVSTKLNGRILTPYERVALSRKLESTTVTTTSTIFPKDAKLNFPIDIIQRAYRLPRIPSGAYVDILSQTSDGSITLVQSAGGKQFNLIFVASEPFPSDTLSPRTVATGISQYGISSKKDYMYIITPYGTCTRVIPNTASGLFGVSSDTEWSQYKVDTSNLKISVWSSLEFQQMYNDAWRMLRDYFYDPNLHGVDWLSVHERYKPLVQRCRNRDDLDEVLGQMIAELSALHSFVNPGDGSTSPTALIDRATLAVSLRRAPEWQGFMITEIPERDPDFNVIDGIPLYSPLHDRALQLSGQRGLKVGDVIVAVNGESVMQVLDVNMLLRGTAGSSVRLDVLRLTSNNLTNPQTVELEPLITVPLDVDAAYRLRVHAWEWRTRQKAKQLAAEAGFTLGYVHLQAMHSTDEDAFARAFFPEYDVDAFIIDVRHNDGGFIDSWLLNTLQRSAWMYWRGRGDFRNGDMDWDEQFAFRGKLVVLLDEFTASNAEGFCRGVSELGLGKLIGKRTWGGGIWGSFQNKLVDGGIAVAPQWGTYNDNFGWGGGVEMTGVSPDIEVDNDPRLTFDGNDQQLERAIIELKKWLDGEPLKVSEPPFTRPDKSFNDLLCPA